MALPAVAGGMTVKQPRLSQVAVCLQLFLKEKPHVIAAWGVGKSGTGSYFLSLIRLATERPTPRASNAAAAFTPTANTPTAGGVAAPATQAGGPVDVRAPLTNTKNTPYGDHSSRGRGGRRSAATRARDAWPALLLASAATYLIATKQGLQY